MSILPPSINDLEKLKSRFSKAFDRESQWESLLDDVYEYFLPQRNLFDLESKGSNKMDKIFDSTSLEAIQEGASKIQENVAPIWKRWAKAEVSEVTERQVEEIGEQEGISLEMIKENLDKQSAIAFDYINRSNFATQFYEVCLDLLVGTATLRIDEEDDLEMPFSFHAIPPKGIAYEEGPQGTIETHWRKFKVQAKHLTRQWQGFKPSKEVADLISDKPEECVEVCEGVVFDPQSKNYYGVAWVKGEDRISWEANFEKSSPWVSGRWAKASGEVRGRGPAMQSYPDVRSLNKAKEFVLQKAAIDIAGMWTATDDGVTNPYNLTVSPGIVIPVASNNSNNPSIARLDTSTNLQLAQFQIEDMRAAIKRSLFNDLRDPAGPVRSATEIAIEARELAKRIGSAFGRLQTELLVPILKRVFYILNKKGLIDINLNGVETTVKFTSPLAAAQDQEDLIAIQQAIEFSYATVGEEMTKVSLEIDKIPAYAANLTGMPQELISSEGKREEKIKAAQQAVMAQQQQGQMQNDMG